MEKDAQDPAFAQVNLEELTLADFLNKELSIKDPEQLTRFLNDFKSHKIYSIYELLDITDWEHISKSFSAHINKIRSSLDKYRNISQSSTSKPEKEKKEENAETLADWNKAKLFLFYEAGTKDMLNKYAKLDKKALKDGFDEQRKDKEFDGGPILNKIEEVFVNFTEPDMILRKNSHGLMLYGPPGKKNFI